MTHFNLEAVKFAGELYKYSLQCDSPSSLNAFSPISTALLSHQIIESLKGFKFSSTITKPCI